MKIEMTRCQDIILYAGVNPNLLQEFWCQLRCTGPDLFSIQKFDGSTAQNIQNGWMPQAKETSTKELRECVNDLNSLQAFLESHFNAATEKVKNNFDFHEERAVDQNCYCIYCKCNNGIIGVGWRFRDGDLVKAKMMATFTLYAFGLSCAESDSTLWDVAYRHLPFATGMDLSIADKVYIKYAL